MYGKMYTDILIYKKLIHPFCQNWSKRKKLFYFQWGKIVSSSQISHKLIKVIDDLSFVYVDYSVKYMYIQKHFV
jgi:hypothetical protein